jgi:hypothetical protein
MPNVFKGGFRPWGTLTGGEGVFPSPLRGELASAYATGVFRHDILIGVTDGTLAVAAAANNGLLLGVAIGFSYVKGDGKRYYAPTIPAATAFTPSTVGSVNASWVDYLALTPDLILEVDANDGTTNTTIAAAIGKIGKNADLVAGTGDTTTGVSGMLLNISTFATTTANFRIIGITGYPVADYGIQPGANDLVSTRAKYLVVCNEGLLPPYTATGV